MIFLIRFITATCLFAFLGKANVWLTPVSNILLAIGYRFFLILSPLFGKAAGKYAVTIALLLSGLGAILFCSHVSGFLVLGALVLGVGLSVSGYLIKAEAAQSPSGAAFNKIALNAGSLLSGVILLVTINSKYWFFGISAFVLFLTALVSFIFSRKQLPPIRLLTPKRISPRRFLAWILLGIAVGIKLFGVFSVLPQYLIDSKGYLPNWYGIMIFLNSGVVILFQLPIIHWIERYHHRNNAFTLVVFFMILGMLLIGFPQILHVQNWTGAVLWTFLLSLIECCASYLDLAAARAQFLLIKETAVGIGAGLTVFFSREFVPPRSNLLIGVIGIFLLGIAFLLLYQDFKTKASQDLPSLRK